MSLAILSLGTSLPTTLFSQEEGRELARYLCAQNDANISWLPSMYDHTGIKTRHTVLDRSVIDRILNDVVRPRVASLANAADAVSHDVFLHSGEAGDPGPTTGERMRVYRESASGLALSSAKTALVEAGLPASAITHVITVSCTGFFAPGIDCDLIHGLGLRPTVQRTHVGFMGCHGVINGLRVAQAFTDADPNARVLLCAVEMCSLHYHYGWDPQQIIANALFADGAAALVGVSATAEKDVWRVRATGSCLLPNSAHAMTWAIGDHGFAMTLAKNVPKLIACHLRPWLTSWLRQHGLQLEEVASWAIHPGGPHILNAVQETLRLSNEALAASRATFAENGNMSSPTLLFILERLCQQKAPRPCVAMGFGPGLVAEAALLG
jgi:alpha-pyrone synthase